MTITPPSNRLTANLLTGLFFLLYYVYFSFLNGYHLMFFEQDQLFRFNGLYFTSLFSKPGGLLIWVNAFLVQFFIQPWLSATVVTVVALLIFYATRRILRFHGFDGFIIPFIPLILLAMTLSNQITGFIPYSGLMLVLLLFNGYILLKNNKLRIVAGLLLITSLYALLGVFAFLFTLMMIFSEISRNVKKESFIISAVFILVMVSTSFLMREVIYFITMKDAFFAPFEFTEDKVKFYILLAALLFFPVVILASGIFKKPVFRWDLKFAGIAVCLFVAMMFFLLRFSYDPRNNKLQEIDFHVQNGEWEEVLKLAREYPGKNQLVLYYSNLALYKTGRMGDQLFYYPQSGSKGLWLEWKRNEVNPFYGGEIFYHLGFSNEAFRWAFEGMEAKGINPRSLQRLVVTAIINGQYEVAQKFIRYLKQSLFYRGKANYYLSLIEHPELIKNDHEILALQSLVPQKDFISYMTPDDIGFYPLLENHPNNRMAFEYMMASFLLNKNMNAFAANIYRIKQLGYSKIPVHFEEAIIIYTGVTKKDIIPEGYSISAASQQRFHSYAEILNMYRDNMDMAAKALNRDFGNTFWFYMQFNNSEK